MPAAKLQKNASREGDKGRPRNTATRGGEERARRNDWGGNLVPAPTRIGEKGPSFPSWPVAESHGDRSSSDDRRRDHPMPAGLDAVQCPHGSEEPAKKEKGEQQTLETILLVQALVVSEAGAACAGSLWAKTGGGCVRHHPISGFGRIQRRASGRPGGKKRIGAKWVPARGKETRGKALHFSALAMIFFFCRFSRHLVRAARRAWRRVPLSGTGNQVACHWPAGGRS